MKNMKKSYHDKPGLHDKERRFRADTIGPSTAIGRKRQAEPGRKCPVQGCRVQPKTWSRYCKRHADRLRDKGHPVLDVRVHQLEEYEKVLKVGRWVRHELTKDDSDRRAWEAIERSLEKLGKDPLLMYDVPTIVRREKHWRNGFKAAVVMHRRMAVGGAEHCAEEVVAGFLGMAALILKDNEVLVNRRQMALFINKAGARAVMRHMRFVGADEHATDKVYKWRPKAGTVTAVGRLVNEQIAEQFGTMWWKGVDEVAARVNTTDPQ